MLFFAERGEFEPHSPLSTLRAGRSIPVGVSQRPPVTILTLTLPTYGKTLPMFCAPRWLDPPKPLRVASLLTQQAGQSKIRMSNFLLEPCREIYDRSTRSGLYVYEKKVMRQADVLGGAVSRDALLGKPSAADPPTMGDRSPRSARLQRTSPNCDMQC